MASKGMKKTKSSTSLPATLNVEKGRPLSLEASPLHILKVHPAKPYDDRSQEELIHEIELLKEKLRVAHASVSNSKAALTLQKQRARHCVMAWRHRVEECRARQKAERAAHDQQMAHIVSSLMAFEEQLRLEQKSIVKSLEEKDSQIVAQQRRIEALTTANERLMKAMGRKQRSASVDHWSELSEDEIAINANGGASRANGAGGGVLASVSMTTVTASTLSGVYAHHATLPRATMPRAASATPNSSSNFVQQQQPQLSRGRSSADTLKEISSMKMSGGMGGRAGALRMILNNTTTTTTTSESDDAKAKAKKSASASKKISAAATMAASKSASTKSSSSSSKDDASGGGSRLVRRASASFRNWWSGSDRSDDDEKADCGWYSDYDLTSYRRHAIHPTARPNAAIIAAAAKTPNKGSTLSRTFKSLLSPNPKTATTTTTTKRARSPKVGGGVVGGGGSGVAAGGGGSIVSSSSEDLGF